MSHKLEDKGQVLESDS